MPLFASMSSGFLALFMWQTFWYKSRQQMQWTFVAYAHQHPLSVQLKSNLSSALCCTWNGAHSGTQGCSPNSVLDSHSTAFSPAAVIDSEMSTCSDKETDSCWNCWPTAVPPFLSALDMGWLGLKVSSYSTSAKNLRIKPAWKKKNKFVRKTDFWRNHFGLLYQERYALCALQRRPWPPALSLTWGN